jgi:uncharacterized protein
MKLLEFLKEPWPWYIAGPLIGLMVPLLLILDNRQFGVSSTMRDFCAAVLPRSNRIKYFSYDLKNEIWRNLLVLGVLIGGTICVCLLNNHQPVHISAKTTEELKSLGINDFSSLAPKDIFGFSSLGKWHALIFITAGGFFVGFGTRYADGCTSGHAITGLSLLAPSSIVAVLGFFAGGLISTYFLLPLILKL